MERTADQAVLRWVCHDHAVAASPGGRRRPDPGSPMGALVDAGSLAEVWVSAGALHARFVEERPASAVVRVVHEAVVDALATNAAWLTEATGPVPGIGLATVQETVDRAAAAVFDAHGGRLEVVHLDDGVLRLRPHGSCRGCRLTAGTIDSLVAPAVRRAHPDIHRIQLEDASSRQRSWLPRPRRR
ncbi:MAG: NifU family protein [Acidimicrobiales bacterium]|nr:NifU family protein [Acidimicrobiales bacterium]